MLRLFGLGGWGGDAAPPPEKTIDSAWGPHLEPLATPVEKAPVAGYEAEADDLFLLSNTFSPAECALLLERSEVEGYGSTAYPKAPTLPLPLPYPRLNDPPPTGGRGQAVPDPPPPP